MITKNKIISKINMIDVTLRDGGLVNDFQFTDDFVKKLYETNLQVGTEYMEFGYKASKEIFSTENYGKWKFCEEESLRKIVGDNHTHMKISVMADVGRTDYKKDILDKKDSVIDMIRVATYSKDILEAVKMIEYIKNKGYIVTCNLMAISKTDDKTMINALKEIGKSSVDGIYIVDSYGKLYPKDIVNLTTKFKDYTKEYYKFIGIHAHNNQQMALANTITAVENGAVFVDVSMNGMGRGAGNCMMELWISYMERNKKYNLKPICAFLENYINPLKEKGVLWGYDFPYLVTAKLNKHPRTAISFIKNNRKDYIKFYQESLKRNDNDE